MRKIIETDPYWGWYNALKMTSINRPRSILGNLFDVHICESVLNHDANRNIFELIHMA